MLLAPIIAQVQTVTGLKKVAGAAAFAAAQNTTVTPPCAYVIPLGDNAAPNRMLSGAIEQRVTERFAVILAATNARDTQGYAANDGLETLRAAVIAALLGWQPSTDYDPIEYGKGGMLALANNIFWWQLEFVTAYYERKV